jgi:hypothetical protein
MDQGIRSRPIYQPIGLDATGRRHLLVADTPKVPDEGLNEDLGVFTEVWTVVHDGRAPRSPFMSGRTEGLTQHNFRSLTLLLEALRQRLTREEMGFRLYAVGSETFLADIAAIGTTAGLSRSEMAMAHVGSKSRRVFCVHCRTMSEGVTENVFECTGCGVHLFVRDHFSARLAAFMGVQVDAEAPGELPAIETLYK